MKTELRVSRPKYNEMADKLSALTISENRSCPSVEVQGRRYVMTGAMGAGTGDGWAHIEGMEVTPIEFYKGELQPLKYGDHWNAVREGNRERAYTGMQITCEGKPVVFIGGKVKFLPLDEGEQLAMF